MAAVYSNIAFTLRRVSTENDRWAARLRESSAALQEATDKVQRTCAEAIARIEAAQTDYVAAVDARQEEFRRVMSVLDRQDLSEMLAERDRLMAEKEASQS